MIRSAFPSSIRLAAVAATVTACGGTVEGSTGDESEPQPIRAQPGEPPPMDDPPEAPPPRPRSAEPTYYADLRLLGKMRLEWHVENNVQKVDAKIDVINYGTGITTGGDAENRVSIDGTPYPASIHGNGAFEDRIPPDETGYIKISSLPFSLLNECQAHTVRIDLDIRWQGGTLPLPQFIFGNDTGRVLTQCPLRWTTPISGPRMGGDPDPLAGLQANPTIAPAPSGPPDPINLNGLTLFDIVSSRVQGTTRGYCSNCHNKERAVSNYYNPDIEKGATTNIFPSAYVGEQTWCGPYGWGEWFLEATPYGELKYEPLRRAIRKWLDDGCQF